MNLRKKCPNCNVNSISVIQILQLMLGQDLQECANCKRQFKLNHNGFLTNSTFWFIEAVIYFCLISISLYYKSWIVFSFGLICTASIEIFMLYIKPIKIIGDKDRMDQVI